ncbi:ROK family protein [Sporosarcina sp. YIM B06819]|uniref:ROK family protein n=1 Tax=Sporosarcina sp. YIM B06819 TaxID=3081769 RepID=UPI00298C97EC|nr:ROK family protein [Sporosarcina sp. YIM B06819]
MEYILAADIGGTKLATALFKVDGTLVVANEIKSEKNDGEKLLQSLIDSFKDICSNAGIAIADVIGISVGLPGIIDVEKGIAILQNNLPWRDFPLKDRLATEFPNMPIVVDNDVYMATWGEYKAREFTKEMFVYMTLSTGISSCSIHNSTFLRGAGMAGEMGFNLTDKPGITLESLVSGPAMEERGRRVFDNPTLTLKEMMEGYYQGDEQVLPIINEAVTTLAKAVYHIIVAADPHCIVLGGGVFNHHPKLVEAVRQEVASYLTHPLLQGKEQRIEASRYKGEAGIRGAASRF